MPKTLTIVIRESADGSAILYDVYDCEPEDVEDTDALEGGIHLGNDMMGAFESAQELVRQVIKERE